MRRLRRALLFMPGDDLHKIGKGAASGVDGVIMDLEDGVALNRKAEARHAVSHALRSLDFGKSEKIVRINAIGSGFELDDLLGTIDAKPDCYMLPKVEQAEHVKQVSAWIGEAEKQHGWEIGGIRLLVMLETPLGIVNVREIAAASDRLDGLVFGGDDCSSYMGAIRSPEGLELLYARSAVVMHAKAFGLQAIDTPFTAINDLEGLAAETRRIMQMGFDGKCVIHPKHIPIIEEVFMPSAEEIERARAVIEAHEAHQQSGTGAFNFEGKMVDMPIIRQAENVLARAGVRR